ncbi:MAG: hypothetical protein B0D92_03390 [Spirochaeta sp. LUC14_002_19_P3]|nr:MAG: hypothetical protein B0D92_03390 [Spirochaeta sp. LUC14_002_19_P3]
MLTAFIVVAISSLIFIGCSSGGSSGGSSEGENTHTDSIMYSAVFKNGSGGVDGLGAAHSVAVSEDGKNVYVAGVNDDALAVFNVFNQ